MLLNETMADALLSGLPGDIGVYICDTATGDTIARNAALPIEAASVIKLLIMVEAFRQREEEGLDFDRAVTPAAADRLPSCGAITYLHDGITLPVRDLVTLMIILSDNTATNLLIDLLGMDKIRATAVRLGLSGLQLNRKLFQPQLAAMGIRNYVTAQDCARLLMLLLEGKLVSAQASEEMLQILRNQRLNGKIPFHLHSRDIDSAHKTGEDDGITHDVGILYADTLRIFCFLSQNTDVPRAERALQDLAALAADVAL